MSYNRLAITIEYECLVSLAFKLWSGFIRSRANTGVIFIELNIQNSELLESI